MIKCPRFTFLCFDEVVCEDMQCHYYIDKKCEYRNMYNPLHMKRDDRK